MRYLEIDDYHDRIFDDIRSLVYDDTQKPHYENERKGIEKLQSILELIKNNNHYPTCYKKAAFLFVALSTGHYFSNGNKRIALFSYLYFAFINKYISRRLKRKKYSQWFKTHFPKYRLSKHNFHTNYGWGLYNFNKAINIKDTKAGHKYTFNELKGLCEKFLQLISLKEKF